jgi:outer membrane protein assembly factor BamB
MSMNKAIKAILLLVTAITLTSCHKGPSVDPVAPLTAFNQTLPVHTLWETSVGSGADKEYLKLSPAIVGNRLYVVDYTGRVTAINTTNGRKIWSTNVKQKITSGVGADNSALYVGTKSAEILALNAADGKLLWKAPVANEILAAPTVYLDTVLVKTLDDHLYALNKQSGQVRWSYNEPTPGMVLRGGNPPHAANGMVVAGFANGQLGVFNAKSGAQVWKQAIAQPQGVSVVEQMVDIGDSLAIADSTIYVATYQGVLSAIALQSGQQKWQHEISSYAGLAVDRHNVYVTDTQSHIWAFNRQTGALVWRQDKLSGRSLTGPAVVGNAIVVGDSKGYVHWLSTTDGSFIARTQSGKKGILSTPLVNGVDVYIYTSAGQLAKYQI